jgi:uncharacterized protein with NRDE domain
MCTVSFVVTSGKFILTSNRDEKTIRPSAIPPQIYNVNGKNVIFPKDPRAGGTWFCVDKNGTVLILLNGANHKHEVQLPYKKSRGLIVLDLISNASPKDFWQEIDLENIEPFTLVLFQNQELFQLQWNGNQKEMTLLDAAKNHIWSSATLYPETVRKQRSDWFYTFLDENPMLCESQMLYFHQHTEKENQENGLVINRNNEMKTLSITQTIIEKNKVNILHYDLIANQEFSETFITI